jgi:hypothetical protein
MGDWPPVYKLLQLFLYFMQQIADHCLITFKVLVSLSKSFKLFEEMHMRQLQFHKQFKRFQLFPELQQLFPEVQNRTSASCACCSMTMEKNATYLQGSYICSDWAKTLFSLIPDSKNMIGNWIQLVYAPNHTCITLPILRLYSLTLHLILQMQLPLHTL